MPPSLPHMRTDKPLTLSAEQRLHVKIYDAEEQVYQLPESNVDIPDSNGTPQKVDLEFTMTDDPFSFAVTRKSNDQVLFNTSGQTLVFESQYLHVRTALPDDPNIYGLGENADPFRHDPSNYSHTVWNSGEAFVPQDANLYGAHPLYYDHRGSDGTHAVFFRNSNGMRINLGADPGNYLEWNTIGGVFDLYYLSGPTPKDVSMQYADVVGHPSLMPYW
jgi:alpha-glucosidase